MSKYKFKVGDRVQFKTWEEMEKEFKSDSYGILCDNDFTLKMRHLCGTQATIESIDGDSCVKLKDFTAIGDIDWGYSTDMIKPYKPKKEVNDQQDVIDYGMQRLGINKIVLPQQEKVNHPSHYNQGNIEVIDYLEGQLSEDEFYGFCIGNVLKYVSRAKHKRETPLEDLKKSKFYLERIIKKLEKENE